MSDLGQMVGRAIMQGVLLIAGVAFIAGAAVMWGIPKLLVLLGWMS